MISCYLKKKNILIRLENLFYIASNHHLVYFYSALRINLGKGDPAIRRGQ